jgi:hypothetical protein
MSQTHVPPEYPIDADEVLRLTGKMPKPRVEKPGVKHSAAQRLVMAKLLAIHRLRKAWKLTAWKDPNSNNFLYDREEVMRKKQERWIPIVR